MRFSLPTSSLLALGLAASKAIACVQFTAYFDDDDYITAYLNDNGGNQCSFNGPVDASANSFIWLNCISGYSATFSWYGTGSVAYATPSFEGNFLTAVEEIQQDAEYIGIYTASVWGC
jgi:hypothetical protein